MDSRYQPDDFGDGGLRHEVNVFVYRCAPDGPEYLLLRPRPASDSLWRPVVKPIQYHQDLRAAAVTAVHAEIGLVSAFDLQCPALGVEEDVGDLHLVGWPVGFRLRNARAAVSPPKELAEFGWMSFNQALHTIGLSVHRQNLLQLHWKLAS